MTHIHFIGKPRQGGYSYVTSPELPGFSLMLDPSEVNDLQKMISALFPAFDAFMALKDRLEKEKEK